MPENSLRGLSSFKQLEDSACDPGGVKQGCFSTYESLAPCEEAKEKRELLETMPSDTPEQVTAKAALMRKRRRLSSTNAAADILVATELKEPKERKLRGGSRIRSVSL